MHRRQIGVDGEPDTGDDVSLIENLFARKSAGFTQPQPRFDAALAVARTIVIADSVQPDAPHFADRAVRQNGGVFLGNRCADSKSGWRPIPAIARRKARRCSCAGEMDANGDTDRGPLAASGGIPRQSRLIAMSCSSSGSLTVRSYSESPIPSNPILTPAAKTAARSGESSMSIGLVLLICR